MEKGSTFSLDKTISETRDELGRTVRGLSDGGIVTSHLSTGAAIVWC